MVMMSVEPPKPTAPIPVRAFQPAYASWHTSTTASDEDRKPHQRFAVKADISATSLIKHLHTLTGHREPLHGELRALESGSIVKVLGWTTIEKHGATHVVYTILSACAGEKACEAGQKSSEARLVQRRYRDFAKLHAALTPIAREAHLTLPALPSKLTFGRSYAAIGSQRKEALHDWLGWVVARPALLCDELRRFLGLSPHADADADLSTRSTDMDVVDEGPRSSSASTTSTPNPSSCDELMLISPVRYPAALEGSNAPAAAPAYTVDLAELEAKAVETMMDDELWGR